MSKELTWSRVGAALLVLVAFLVGWPFALLGFAFEFIEASFEVGQGLAELLEEWLKNQL